MKRMLSWLLVLMMLASMLCVSAGAADGSGLLQASASQKNGTVTLVLTAMEDTTSGRITVSYDRSLLRYQDAEIRGNVSGTQVGEGTVTFGYASNGDSALAAGKIVATLRFASEKRWESTELQVTVEDFNAQEGLHLALPTVTVDYAKFPFTDVTPDKWYYEAVYYTWQNNLFQGVEKTIFLPGGSMTRAMFVTVLGRMAGVEENRKATIKFSDVRAGSYYVGYVAWAVEAGIVKGTSDTTFSPDANLTREQMVTMLYRYAKAQKMDVSVKDATCLNAFPDHNAISGWAKDAMAWAVSRNIIIGTGAGLLPRADATRAQSAQVLMDFGHLAA